MLEIYFLEGNIDLLWVPQCDDLVSINKSLILANVPLHSYCSHQFNTQC